MEINNIATRRRANTHYLGCVSDPLATLGHSVSGGLRDDPRRFGYFGGDANVDTGMTLFLDFLMCTEEGVDIGHVGDAFLTLP